MSNEIEVVRDLPIAPMTPMQMIQMAVQQGQSVDQLEKLFALKLRVDADEARKAYFAALNEFKKNPPQINKNKDVAHNGVFKYKHATLDNASKLIGDALSKVDISHHWDTEHLVSGQIRVTCILTHAMGHSERTPLQAAPDTSGGKNAIQAVGSTVTYLQRYTLLAATGMAVTGSDDDGKQGAKGMSAEAKADWLATIESHTDAETTGDLWKKIAAATTAARDVEAHDELRIALMAKTKALKSNKGTQQI